MAPRKVTALSVAGTMTWDPVSDPTLLPPGVTFDETTGSFVGTPTEIGTYGPVTVTGTDTFGNGLTDTATTNAITFQVNKGAVYINLLAETLPDATKRSELPSVSTTPQPVRRSPGSIPMMRIAAAMTHSIAIRTRCDRQAWMKVRCALAQEENAR